MCRTTVRRRPKLGILFVAAATAATILSPPASATPDQFQQLALVREAGDGRQLIFLWDTSEQGLGYLVDLAGRDAIQPAWSPDGQTLAFAAQTEPGGPFALYTVRPGAPNQFPVPNQDLEQLTFPFDADQPSEGDFSPAWSPDGQWIAFARTIDGTSKIFYRHVDLVAEDRLTSDPWSYEVEPSWMPDSTTVVFANRSLEPGPDDDLNSPAFRFHIAAKSVLDGGFGFATAVAAESGVDLRTPDVAPDGSAIAATATFVDFGFTMSAIAPLPPTGFVHYRAFDGAGNPDWSPDGGLIAADVGADFDFVVFTGPSGSVGGAQGSDAAWRPHEHVSPSIVIAPRVDEEGWLASPGVTVTAADEMSGVSLVECDLDGARILHEGFGDRLPLPSTVVTKAFVDGPEGSRTLVCWATDGSGNVTSASADLMVDFDAPRIGTPTFPSIVRFGEPVRVTAPFTEDGSGIEAAYLYLRSDPYFFESRMEEAGGELVGEAQPRVGVYEVIVAATDLRGQEGLGISPDRVVVFDPSAGSATGSGSIVPGGWTSDAGDALPEIDGVTKASFSFGAEYRSDSAETPSGSLNVSYGSRFKLKSTGLVWFVRNGSSALFQGTAEIHGRPGTFLFQVEVTDAVDDRFELRVWPAGAQPFADRPAFQATGDVGGQIHIRA